jgi:hypothetical protein
MHVRSLSVATLDTYYSTGIMRMNKNKRGNCKIGLLSDDMHVAVDK